MRTRLGSELERVSDARQRGQWPTLRRSWCFCPPNLNRLLCCNRLFWTVILAGEIIAGSQQEELLAGSIWAGVACLLRRKRTF
jgi:hypothetical protein